jgi:glucosamine--fructose-6-phosphate aminotransferase (isomerizing)
MLKEISEQPETIANCLGGRLQFDPPAIELPELAHMEQTLKDVRRVVLVGMGTSWHAAMLGRVFIEQLARIPTEVENASEFRYRGPVLGPETLVISVGQSGETVDTLAAMEEAKHQGSPQITVCNIDGSQATRVAEGTVLIRGGLEVAVASTKCLTNSTVALLLLAVHMGRLRGTLPPEQLSELATELARLPGLLGGMVEREHEYQSLANRLYRYDNFLFLGRGVSYPVALEGALKLKEVSYIHAEGYAAGEMKHGPIALIDERMPVIAIAPRDGVHDKMCGNVQEVKARDGTVIAVVTEGDDEEMCNLADHVITIPQVPALLSPIVTVVPLQFLAYHVGLRRGCDVDQPRTLAKTVTVE